MRHRYELPQFLTSHGYGRAVEVGSHRGEFADYLLANWGGNLTMIDAWRHLPGYRDIFNVSDDEHEEAYYAAIAVADKYPGRAHVAVGLSVEMAENFDSQSLDFVYIDADHSEAAVLADLAAWVPKIRPDGAIGGHDYLDGELPEGDFGVKSAVTKFFGREPDIITLEKWPSWFVKLS